jgi:hypothetical protein
MNKTKTSISLITEIKIVTMSKDVENRALSSSSQFVGAIKPSDYEKLEVLAMV